jgi:hypothetical protein
MQSGNAAEPWADLVVDAELHEARVLHPLRTALASAAESPGE